MVRKPATNWSNSKWSNRANRTGTTKAQPNRAGVSKGRNANPTTSKKLRDNYKCVTGKFGVFCNVSKGANTKNYNKFNKPKAKPKPKKAPVKKAPPKPKPKAKPVKKTQPKPKPKPKPMAKPVKKSTPKPKQKKAPAKKAPVKKTEKNIIVDEWDDNFLGILLSQNDVETFNKISNFIKKQNNKKKPIYVNLISSFTKKYNDEVIEKKGAKTWLEGLQRIVRYINSGGKVLNPMLKGQRDRIPKGAIKERNKEKVFKELGLN